MILPYLLSLAGMLLRQSYLHRAGPDGNGAMLCTVAAVVLTAVGVKMTYTRLGGRYADRGQLLLALLAHAAVWLAGLFAYGAVTWLLDKIGAVVYFVATVIGLLIGIQVMGGGFGGIGGGRAGGGSEAAGEPASGIGGLPTIIYDSNNDRWQCRYRSGDHAVYFHADGREVTLYHADVSGTSANTSAGSFHWY